MKHYYIYILANKKNGSLYIGFTDNILRRIWQHKSKLIKGFTSKYNIENLVYLESYDNPIDGIKREKQLKKWKRSWKIKLIEENNPDWEDLYNKILVLLI